MGALLTSATRAPTVQYVPAEAAVAAGAVVAVPVPPPTGAAPAPPPASVAAAGPVVAPAAARPASSPGARTVWRTDGERSRRSGRRSAAGPAARTGSPWIDASDSAPGWSTAEIGSDSTRTARG